MKTARSIFGWILFISVLFWLSIKSMQAQFAEDSFCFHGTWKKSQKDFMMQVTPDSISIIYESGLDQLKIDSATFSPDSMNYYTYYFTLTHYHRPEKMVIRYRGGWVSDNIILNIRSINCHLYRTQKQEVNNEILGK